MRKLVSSSWLIVHSTLVIFFLALFLLLPTTGYQPSTTYAFSINQPAGYGIDASGDADSLLTTIVQNAITIVFAIAGLLVVFFLIWGAIDWIMSGGDKEKVGNARKKITSALIGLALLAFVFVITTIIGQIVGFDPLREEGLPIPSLGG